MEANRVASKWLGRIAAALVCLAMCVRKRDGVKSAARSEVSAKLWSEVPVSRDGRKKNRRARGAGPLQVV